MSSSLQSDPPPELSVPPFNRLLEAQFFLPFLFYLVCWRSATLFVQSFLWHDYPSFKQYRLRNLTICLVHSVISGLWSFTFLCSKPEVMFEQTIHWYEAWAAHLPIISIAYFVNDSLDMAAHELSRWTIELYLHHAVSILAFLFAVLPQKFIPYAYWALLMEVNSIFLHIRSMMQISGTSSTYPRIFSSVQYLNVVTFILFRYCVQCWKIKWAVSKIPEIHTCYSFITLGGGVTFLIINSILFYRVLSSDGFLGQRFATNPNSRDEQHVVKIMGTKKKDKDN